MSKKCESWIFNSLIHFKNQFFKKKVYTYAIGAFLFFQFATAISDYIVQRISPEATNSNNKNLNDLSKTSMTGALLILSLFLLEKN
ncbi:hypothetical protein BCR36DRAFT_580000 [Piromyces finnis]|uniref:Uncharacterized protein n=1 Tax=Piromyces finnis TaxID=1754191 RepID=A0A1Y1VJU9_9FUNG|nr:hypothetical protein BCR36DRAFT_580000 [Piromyces finnis]|eukprot:ORX58370.1 hypothetical protein BCR36DRAFT_580000 [Piromyces finnis]